MRARIVAPSLLGNILEWYDFSLFGYFSAIFARLFFPTEDALSGMLMSFAVFAVGFIARPIGAIVWGHWGDRHGRKKTLFLTIIIMAVSTTAIGLLPTFEQVGRLAPILLILCRLTQGFAVSGEFTGTIIYIIEHAERHRGWYGSWTMASAFLGLLLGSLAGTFVTQLLSEPELYQWGWRLPFLVSIVLGAIGLYLRMNMPETPHFLKLLAHTVERYPVRYVLVHERAAMLKAVGLTLLSAVSFYITFVYFVFYLKTYLNYELADALTINSICMLVSIILMPIIGMLSDKFGRKIFLTIGALGFLLGSYPLLVYCQTAALKAVFITQLYFSIMLSFICGMIPVTLVELFKTKARYTAFSLSFNLSQALFGGTVPLVMTAIIAWSQDKLALAYYLMLAGGIVLIVLAALRDRFQEPLN